MNTKVWKGKIYIKSFNQGFDLKYNFECDWLIELRLTRNSVTQNLLSFLNKVIDYIPQ